MMSSPHTQPQSPSLSDAPNPALAALLEDLQFLDDWDDRYRYLIDLGKTLPPLPQDAYCEVNKVQGCASQVWLVLSYKPDGTLILQGDSDALIVKGLVALVLAVFNGLTPDQAVQLDINAIFSQIGLQSHLTAQRANGLAAMVSRIKNEAGRAV